MYGPDMARSLLVVFAAIAGLMGLLGVLYSPVTFGVALPFAVAAVILWYQVTGRFTVRAEPRARRVGREGDRGDGRTGRRETGTGPRDASAGPRGPNFGDARFRGDRFRDGRYDQGPFAGPGGPRGTADGGRAADPGSSGPTRREAGAVLDVDPDADEAAIRSAYRERVKELHPDRGGDEEAFKRVTRAYERLRE